MFIDGKGIMPSKWHEHVNHWVNNPFNADIIFVKYEDLLENPLQELKRICQFSNLERSDTLLNSVIQGNTIDNMKLKAKQFNRMGNIEWEGDKVNLFFRKGVKGTYLESIPKEIITIFENEANFILNKFNY